MVRAQVMQLSSACSVVSTRASLASTLVLPLRLVLVLLLLRAVHGVVACAMSPECVRKTRGVCASARTDAGTTKRRRLDGGCNVVDIAVGMTLSCGAVADVDETGATNADVHAAVLGAVTRDATSVPAVATDASRCASAAAGLTAVRLDCCPIPKNTPFTSRMSGARRGGRRMPLSMR